MAWLDILQESALCKFFSLQNDPEPELNDDLELAKRLSMFTSCNDGQRSIGEQVGATCSLFSPVHPAC